MNQSAKVYAVSIVAASALGLAAFVGCTTNSTLGSDTDGGTRSSSGNTTNPDSDSGTGSTGFVVGSVCKTTSQQSRIESDTCQQCLEQKCCTALQGCFSKQVDGGAADGGADTCETYSDEYSKCLDKTGTEQDTCIEGVKAAFPDFANEFGDVQDCGNTQCQAECDVADGG